MESVTVTALPQTKAVDLIKNNFQSVLTNSVLLSYTEMTIEEWMDFNNLWSHFQPLDWFYLIKLPTVV